MKPQQFTVFSASVLAGVIFSLTLHLSDAAGYGGIGVFGSAAILFVCFKLIHKFIGAGGDCRLSGALGAALGVTLVWTFVPPV